RRSTPTRGPTACTRSSSGARRRGSRPSSGSVHFLGEADLRRNDVGFDSLVGELGGLFGGRLPANPPRLFFVVVDAAGHLGEALADVLRARDDELAQRGDRFLAHAGVVLGAGSRRLRRGGGSM